MRAIALLPTLGAALLAACSASQKNSLSSQEQYEPWALPSYEFQDSGQFISVTGTLKGEGVGYRVNTWKIHCFAGQESCQVASVEEIGPEQLGDIHIEYMKISSWNDKTITLDSDDLSSCGHQILVLNRVAKVVTFTSSAQNFDKDYCRKFYNYDGKSSIPSNSWEIGQPNQPWEK